MSQQHEGLTILSPNSRNKCRSAKAKQSPLVKSNFKVENKTAGAKHTESEPENTKLDDPEPKKINFDGCKSKSRDFEVLCCHFHTDALVQHYP